MASYGFEYDEAARREAGVDFTDSAMSRLVNSGERGLPTRT